MPRKADLQGDLLRWAAEMSKRILMENKDGTGVGQVGLLPKLMSCECHVNIWWCDHLPWEQSGQIKCRAALTFRTGSQGRLGSWQSTRISPWNFPQLITHLKTIIFFCYEFSETVCLNMELRHDLIKYGAYAFVLIPRKQLWTLDEARFAFPISFC